VRRRKDRILRRKGVVPSKRGGRVAVALAAVAGDSRVQDRIRRQGRRRVVARRRGVTLGTGEVAWIRHMPGGQCGAVPVRGGVAAAAIIGCRQAAGVVCGSALERWTCSTHEKGQTRFMAAVAGRGHEGMLGLIHVHRPEGAGGISG